MVQDAAERAAGEQQAELEGDGAAAAIAGGGGAAAAPTLASILAPLEDIAPSERSFSCRALLKSLELLEHVKAQLLSRKPPDEETLADQDGILLAWLAAYFQGVSGTQAIIHGDLLEPALTASGMVAPFVQSAAPGAGGAAFGVPSKVGPDVMCTSASELLRMATAALISLYVYLNFSQGPNDLPADEALLVYATLAIASCADADNAAALDAQLAALVDAAVASAGGGPCAWLVRDGGADGGAPPAPLEFGCAQVGRPRTARGAAHRALRPPRPAHPPHHSTARRAARRRPRGPQVRWLMHYVRGLVEHHMGAVCHLLGDTQRQAACYAAQQKDMAAMAACLPGHALGYSLFARCAMNNQAMPLAAAFLERGLAAAAAARHDAATATMAFQRAAALLLGGGGPALDAGEVRALLSDGEAARGAVLAWFPAPWRPHAADGEPDRSLVQKLLAEWEKRHGSPLPDAGEAEALSGLLYVTKAPSTLPPGALQQTEEGEEGEEGEAAAAGAGSAGGGGGGGRGGGGRGRGAAARGRGHARGRGRAG
ncbi:hypothetical protein HT031_000975 [Scenedesmus sp. PABB004]|nr:hypothetical protein HT031_000975 [Scenedesmus sp. PABB004]